MALTAPTNLLTAQAVQDSFDQLLYLDNASGMASNTLKIISTENSKSCLSISENHMLLKGVDTDNAALLQISKATDGASILTIDASTPIISAGVNDLGIDVKFFGATSGKYMLWDESQDTLVISGQIDFNAQGSGESISGDGTDLILNSGSDITLTATNDVNIPVNVGLRFGDGNQHIETDNTDLTITSDVSINLSAPQVDLLVDTNFVTTGGVNGMSIDGTTFSVDGANDRVGIGTATPDYALHVEGTGDKIIGLSCGTDADATLYLGETGKESYGRVRYDANIDAMYLYTNDSIKQTILTSGNVGIGDISPQTLLSIKGDATNTSQPDGLQTGTDVHTALHINNSGGDIAEKYGMQFGCVDNYSFGGMFGVGTSIAGNTIGAITFDMRATTGSTALTEVMRIQYDGNVGIGTTTPGTTAAALDTSTVLHIQDSAEAVYLVLESSSAGSSKEVATVYSMADTGTSAWYTGLNGTNDFQFAYGTAFAGVNAKMTILDTGQVGIGTVTPDDGTANACLAIADDRTDKFPLIELRGGRGVGGNQIGQIDFININSGDFEIAARILALNSADGTDEGQLTFSTDNGTALSERMRIDQDGKVGIGTSSPGMDLQIINTSGSGHALTLGYNVHRIAMDVDIRYADSGDNSVIKEAMNQSATSAPKIPAGSIITLVGATVKTVTDLGTHKVNIFGSSTTGTAADSTVAGTVTELLGAGATGTQSTDSASVTDIDLTQAKETWVTNTLNRAGTANDQYIYICNAGTGNGTTNSTAGTLSIFVEYIGID